MATEAENRAEWKRLHENWVFANQAARQARYNVTGDFAAAAAGKGAGPTVATIDAAETLERKADDARALADIFVNKLFE